MSLILLFGGTSGERRVSVASAQNVSQLIAFDALWYEAPDGRVFSVTVETLRAHQRPFEIDFAPADPPSYPTLLAAFDDARFKGSTFFLGFHGGKGEDGTVQKQLEDRGYAFTGSGSHASARAFDKVAAKNIARSKGARVADAVVLAQRSPDAARAALVELLKKHGRVVVKPVNDGSSVGLHHVKTEHDIETVVADVVAHPERPYLAEAFLKGTELTCGVVQDDKGTRALPPSEVRMAEGRAFDFEGKYLGKGTTELTPAQVSPEITRAAQALALTVHQAMGCRGYTRTDMIVVNGEPYFLEINTLPGLTQASFIPQQLGAEGTPIETFLKGQITLAAQPRAVH